MRVNGINTHYFGKDKDGEEKDIKATVISYFHENIPLN